MIAKKKSKHNKKPRKGRWKISSKEKPYESLSHYNNQGAEEHSEEKILEELLAQGKTQGSTPRVHQQALTTGSFDSTYEADAISLEVAMRGL
jgi:hypothetical protein